MISRRIATCLTVLGFSALASISTATAQDYPTRSVRWIVGYAPGGATDIIARLIGTPEDFGKLIVAETDKWAKVVKATGVSMD